MAKAPASFQLTKWYADVVDDVTGELAIGYHSEVRWRGLWLRFFNLLRFVGRTTLRTTASFWRQPTVTLAPNGATLMIRGRQLTGDWHALQPAIRERLLDTPEGHVQWDCWLPAARAELTAPTLPTPLRGLGYAERLTITLPPWRLPIRTLRWGRFLAEGHAIVWIQWQGSAPRCLIWHNGRRYPDGHIADDELRFGTFHLALTDRATLRDGPLIRTVFRRAPWLRALFPARILNLAECKWQTRGVLAAASTELATGWSVHERVDWPEDGE